MYNIVGAMFASEEEARKALEALAEAPKINGTTILQMSLVKRKGGELKLCDNFTSEHLTGNDTVKGGLIGGLIGILGGPVGMLLGGATGALLGKAVDKEDKLDSQTLIAQAAQKLEEGDLALIILADETDEAILDRMLVKYNVVVIRYDAEVIAKEVEKAEKLEKELAEAKEEENK